MTPEERAKKVIEDGQFCDCPMCQRLITEALRASIAEEREACARAAETFNAELYRDPGDGGWRPGQPVVSDGKRIAAAIRGRKE